MLVYGDSERSAETADEIRYLGAALADLGSLPIGIRRHGALVSAFVRASGLVQGVADAECEARGRDARSPAHEAGMGLLVGLAGAVGASWRDGLDGTPPDAAPALAALASLPLPLRIRIRQAEGYAFYALYPEAVFEAAATLAGSGPVRVLGIRSIGTGLAALAAAALGAALPDTLRPVGHPFDRRIAAAPELEAALSADRDSLFVVADEGPGLSGSSFGAVADWLEGLGVDLARIAFLPSHAGEPGPRASARRRERWAAARRPVVTFENLALRSAHPAQRLESWVRDLVGAPLAPLEDWSGGAWRGSLFASESQWPESDIRQERRKYLLRAESGAWLLKFAGLGPVGADKLGRAQLLHEAGFTPEPAGLRHGFLVERRIAGAAPLGPDDPDRAGLIDRIGAYLGFRSRHFADGDAHGADLGRLLSMACHNACQAFDVGMARRFDALAPRVDALTARVRRVRTDNRMLPWEWLRAPDGRLLKADALDHDAAHDLVGCQDIAWDIAGAAIEFAMSETEAERLRASVAAASGIEPDPGLIAVLRPCYLAFRLGSLAMAAAALAGASEERRLNEAAARVRARLAAELDGPISAASAAARA